MTKRKFEFITDGKVKPARVVSVAVAWTGDNYSEVKQFIEEILKGTVAGLNQNRDRKEILFIVDGTKYRLNIDDMILVKLPNAEGRFSAYFEIRNNRSFSPEERQSLYQLMPD